jgi:DNA-directed RNA polymerase sigma subunit (sigma70/sigma32)
MQITAEETIPDLIQSCLPDLDETEREFVQAYYLTDRRGSLEKLAGKFGLSSEGIRNLRDHALRRLKDLLVAKKVTSMRDILL